MVAPCLIVPAGVSGTIKISENAHIHNTAIVVNRIFLIEVTLFILKKRDAKNQIKKRWPTANEHICQTNKSFSPNMLPIAEDKTASATCHGETHNADISSDAMGSAALYGACVWLKNRLHNSKYNKETAVNFMYAAVFCFAIFLYEFNLLTKVPNKYVLLVDFLIKFTEICSNKIM